MWEFLKKKIIIYLLKTKKNTSPLLDVCITKLSLVFICKILKRTKINQVLNPLSIKKYSFRESPVDF